MNKNLVIQMTDGSTLQVAANEVEFIALDEVLFDNKSISKSIRVEKIGIIDEGFVLTDSQIRKVAL
jgi:hypothetical protein